MNDLFDMDLFNSVNPTLTHGVRGDWRLPVAGFSDCPCCKKLMLAMWHDNTDRPESEVFLGRVCSCGKERNSIKSPLLNLGSLNEQMRDLEIIGFEYREDLNWPVVDEVVV